MSAADNREVLEEAVRMFSAGDVEGYLDTLYAPDAALYFLPPGLPGGIEGARMFYGGFLGAFPGAHLTIDDMVQEGDTIAARFHLNMTHTGDFQGLPPTGKQVRLTGITMMRFRDGKVVERWSEADFMSLMQQLGAFAGAGEASA